MVFAAAGLAAWMLIRWAATRSADRPVTGVFFAASTSALLAVSVCLQSALGQVRRERQRRFRGWLLGALAAATVFGATQSCALRLVWLRLPPESAQTGASAFVFVFAALHGMHVSVAVLFLNFVVLQALAQRYDHEYHFGVTVCTFFWHLLGAVWACILGVIALTS